MNEQQKVQSDFPTALLVAAGQDKFGEHRGLVISNRGGGQNEVI